MLSFRFFRLFILFVLLPSISMAYDFPSAYNLRSGDIVNISGVSFLLEDYIAPDDASPHTFVVSSPQELYSYLVLQTRWYEEQSADGSEWVDIFSVSVASSGDTLTWPLTVTASWDKWNVEFQGFTDPSQDSALDFSSWLALLPTSLGGQAPDFIGGLDMTPAELSSIMSFFIGAMTGIAFTMAACSHMR